jgi:3-deoxy-D-manno-octulosonate 8-phosphate phosphatase (KDO 8-P phosphatase)
MELTEDNEMEQAKDIKLVILDVDGVMTDGRIVIDDNGVETRNFDIKDGMGVVVMMMSGVEVAIITSKKSGAVRHRAEELKIKRFHEGIKKKTEPYEEMLKEMNITDAQVAYVGDDLVDLSMMKRVGLPIAVGDAVEDVKQHAAYVTKARGGYGAVREVAEMILKAQGKWDKILSKIS